MNTLASRIAGELFPVMTVTCSSTSGAERTGFGRSLIDWEPAWVVEPTLSFALASG
jgi:hypothetical protein